MIRLTMPSGLCIECDEPHEAIAVIDRFMPTTYAAAAVATAESESEGENEIEDEDEDENEDTALESPAPPKKSKQQRRVERLREAGSCIACGKPADGTARCDACTEKRNARRRKSSDRKRGTRSNPAPGTKIRRLVDWLTDNGPARPGEIAKAMDLPSLQVSSLLGQYRGKSVRRNDDGTYEAIVEKADDAPSEVTPEVEADNDEPFLDDPLPDDDADVDDGADDDAEPEQVESPLRRVERPPLKPRRSKPPQTAGERLQLPNFTAHVSSAADRAADVAAAELCVADRPLSLAKLARLTKFDPEFLATALKDDSRFESTPDGYQLVN